jgi:cation transport regulator
MPYKTLKDLPESVKSNLPKHAQEIFKESFNHAWEQYVDRKDREVVSFKVAWAAVKKKYKKIRDKWVKI